MFRTMALPDDRTLEYLELGDQAGIPVVYCHGTPSTAGLARICAESAKQHGVRLVAVSRPGYGDSSPSAPGLTAAASDALALADHLGFDRFALMGASGGGPFALATAAVAPGRVTEVILLGGSAAYFEVVPPSDDDAAERRALDTYRAGHTDQAVADLTASADADFGPLRGLSEADFAAAWASHIPPGETWLERHPQARTLFVTDFQRSIADSAGYVRDVLSWGIWDVDLTSVTCPVRMFCGDTDAMVPMAHAQWLRERLPSAELVVVAGGHGDATLGAADQAFAALASQS